MAYSRIWWFEICQAESPPSINTDAVASKMEKFLAPKLRDSSALNLVVRESDIERYRGVLEELERTIRVAGLQGVWFKSTSSLD